MAGDADCDGTAVPASAGAGSVSGKWQATRWPGASSLGSGTSLAHLSVARGQRGRKRQADGGRIGEGGPPCSVAAARAAPGSVEGIESSSAFVYGCKGCLYTDSPGP